MLNSHLYLCRIVFAFSITGLTTSLILVPKVSSAGQCFSKSRNTRNYHVSGGERGIPAGGEPYSSTSTPVSYAPNLESAPVGTYTEFHDYPYFQAIPLTPPIKGSGFSEKNLYEIPTATVVRNEEDFRTHSGQHEDALRNLQIVFIVDHSGSQGSDDTYPHSGPTPTKGMLGASWTQWDNTYMITRYLAESFFEYDRDGQIPVVFFSSKAHDQVIQNTGELLNHFKRFVPSGCTNLAAALNLAFDKYMGNSQERTLFIVLTDGQPTGSESEIKSLIQRKISQVDPSGNRLNIMFIRVGDDPNAIRFLADLDDCTEIGKNVDTKSDNMVYKMGPKNMILNAIFEHLDYIYPEYT